MAGHNSSETTFPKKKQELKKPQCRKIYVNVTLNLQAACEAHCHQIIYAYCFEFFHKGCLIKDHPCPAFGQADTEDRLGQGHNQEKQIKQPN